MYLKALLDTVTPQLFARAFAVPGSIVMRDGDIYCSFRDMGVMRIHAGGFVAEPIMGSQFVAGSVIDVLGDMLAVTTSFSNKNCGKHVSAVRILCDTFKSMLPAELQSASMHEIIGQQASDSRKLYEYVMCERPGTYHKITIHKKIHVPVVRDREIRTYLRGDPIQGYMIVLDPMKGPIKMTLRLQKAGCREYVKFPSGGVYVIPYFANAYEIAAVEIISAVTLPVTTRTIWITDHKVAFAGLPFARAMDEVFLEDDLRDMLHDVRTCPEKNIFFSRAIFQPEGTRAGWLPKRLCFVNRGEELRTPAQLERCGAQCLITNYPSVKATKAAGVLSWTDAAAEIICRCLDEDDEFSPRVRYYLDSVRATRIVRLLIRRHLLEQGKHQLAAQLDSVMQGGIIWQGKTGRVYASSAGYMHEDELTAEYGGNTVTNFILEPLYSVVYENGDTYYTCKLLMRDDDRIVSINAADLATPMTMTAAIRQQIALSGSPTVAPPSLYEATYGRYIIPWLFQQFSELPTMRGIRGLGWNGSRTVYNGPDFRVTKEGITYGDIAYHPEARVLSYFDSRTERTPASNVVEGLPEDLLSLIKWCAGLIVRSYMGYPGVRRAYSDEPAAAHAEYLQAIFSYLGQNRGVDMPLMYRDNKAMLVLCGYPFWTQGSSGRFITKKGGIVTTHRPSLTFDEHTPEQLEHAGMLLRFITENIPVYLLAHGEVPFELKDENEATVADFEIEGWKMMMEVI